MHNKTNANRILVTALSLSLALSPLVSVSQALAETVDDQGVTESAIDVETVLPETADEAGGPADEQLEAMSDGQDASEASAQVMEHPADSCQTKTTASDFSQMECKTELAYKDSFGVDFSLDGITVGDDIEDYCVRYWLGDEEASATERALTAENVGERMSITCFSIQLSEPIHVRVYRAGADDPVASSDFCIRECCERIIDEEGGSTEMNNICVAMLRYGSASQRLLGYHTDDLADKNLPVMTNWDEAIMRGYDLKGPNGTFYDHYTLDHYAATSTGSTKLVKKTTASLSLDSQLTINYYITPADGVDGNGIPLVVDRKVLRNNDVSHGLTGGATITRETLDDGRVHVRVAGITPNNLTHNYRLEMGDGDDVRTVNYSALSYAQAKQYVKGYEDISRAIWGLACARMRG